VSYGAKDLAYSFRTVRNNTLKIAEEIPAEKYSFRAAPDTRSVGELLTHIAVGQGFQQQIHAEEKRKNLDGFDFGALMQKLSAEEKTPRTKDEIVALLRANGEKWAKFLESCSDSFLDEVVQMPAGANPATRSRVDMIMSVKEHEMHHRGQLMLIERMIGIVPHLTRDMQARFAARAQQK
jgi:uncharacterized damage-inducible protein DinB